ncbi:hypothetical protein PQQ51_21640 [Paraburkholderia xenovorans]|uniref:hypothetical protein n=1 Tax=Paraburkholderia xenovorans TaxID=36873 RepID=UPI0038BB4C05
MRKDASLIPHYYHPDFQRESNGQLEDYQAFASGHEKMYATPVTFEVRYDDASWVESAAKVAVRLWIRKQTSIGQPLEFEILLVAAYLDGKIHHLWEMTSPRRWASSTRNDHGSA